VSNKKTAKKTTAKKVGRKPVVTPEDALPADPPEPAVPLDPPAEAAPTPAAEPPIAVDGSEELGVVMAQGKGIDEEALADAGPQDVAELQRTVADLRSMVNMLVQLQHQKVPRPLTGMDNISGGGGFSRPAAAAAGGQKAQQPALHASLKKCAWYEIKIALGNKEDPRHMDNEPVPVRYMGRIFYLPREVTIPVPAGVASTLQRAVYEHLQEEVIPQNNAEWSDFPDLTPAKRYRVRPVPRFSIVAMQVTDADLEAKRERMTKRFMSMIKPRGRRRLADSLVATPGGGTRVMPDGTPVGE